MADRAHVRQGLTQPEDRLEDAVIHPEDAEFHFPDTPDPTWAETNYFGLYIPEVPLNIGVYALFRSSLGVVNSTVSVNSRQATRPWEAEYWDHQAHLPFPASRSLLHYELANGLTVRCVDPNRRWQVRFEDGEGTRLAFEYTALMDPFDIHDPDQDPMVAAQAEGHDFAWGTAYAGHFDQTGRFEGELELRGRRYQIDCVSTMDHSWGPRPERVHKTMSWLHGHFAPGKFFHAILDFDERDGPDGPSKLSLTHGYLVDDGQMHGLRAGHGLTERGGCFPRRTRLELTDRRGVTWEVEGEAQTTFPWLCWPDMVGFNVLHRWRSQAGDGWGEVMDFYGMPQVTELYA